MCYSNPTRYCNSKAKSMLDDAVKSLKEAELSDDAGILHDAKLSLIKAQDIYDETPPGLRRISIAIKQNSNPKEKEDLIIRRNLASQRKRNKNNQAVILSGKKCPACKIHKEHAEYSNHKNNPDGLQTVCKKCQELKTVKGYRENSSSTDQLDKYLNKNKNEIYRLKFLKFKEGCTDCKKFYPNAMDFDHVTGQKSFNISEIYQYGLDYETQIKLVKEEMEKCEVRCGNCHRKATYRRSKKSERLTYLENPSKANEKRKVAYDFLLKSECTDCKTKDFEVLEFDHVNGIKKEDISKMLRKSSWTSNDVQEEIEKCEVRCVNCHRAVTHIRKLQKPISIQESRYKPQEIDLKCSCGKEKQYGNLRCQSCHNDNRKIEWPTMESIIQRLEKESFLSLGKSLGVSDNAIRKRLKKYGFDPKNFSRS